MIYRLSLIILILNCYLLGDVQQASAINNREDRILVVAGDENFPPYEFVDVIDGAEVYRGFNVDLIKAVALSTGYEIRFRPMPWVDAAKALERGEVDAVKGMKYNTERKLMYDFSNPYMMNSLAIFVRADMNAIASVADLAGYKVAVQKDDAAHHRLNGHANLVLANDQEAAMELLLNGSVDAVFGNKLTSQYILQRTKKHSYVKIVGGDTDAESYCVAVRNGDPILDVFNKGLKEIKDNGTYDKIYAKWFGEPVDQPARNYKRNFGIAVGVALILVMLGVAINLYLQREVKKRTNECQKNNEELQRKDKLEALGKLVACIAHEIRTPLTSIKTFVELLPTKYDSPLFREKINQFVPQEVERLNGIVNDLLNYANPRKVERELVPLKQLVDNALVFFADKIASRDIELQLDVKEDLYVVVDRQQMKQVMINLLLNALEAMAGCPHPVLAIAGELRDGQVWLRIVDNGDGIAQQEQQFIFEPFFSTRTGGTGLGLFVSYQLARQNGVEIVIDSKKQSGTKACLKFSQQKDQYA